MESGTQYQFDLVGPQPDGNLAPYNGLNIFIGRELGVFQQNRPIAGVHRGTPRHTLGARRGVEGGTRRVAVGGEGTPVQKVNPLQIE